MTGVTLQVGPGASPPGSRPKSGPGSDVWLEEHGISAKVWETRPYVRYGPGSAVKLAGEDSWVGSTEGMQRVLDEYEGLDFKQQIKFALDIANGGKNPYRRDNLAKYPEGHPRRVDAGGFLIMRHAPPGLEHYGKLYAEMRPDNAVATRLRTWHYHGPRPYPKHVEIDKKTGRPCKPKENGGGPVAASHIYTPEQMKDHIAREFYEDDHYPGDPRLDRVHWQQRVAKYCFIPGLWEKIPVQRKDGTWTERRMQDEESIARRLDMHPIAAERLEAGTSLVYLCAEGCIKADAILSEIIRRDLDASVVSVPSVTLWKCEELEDFIRMYLPGKRVVIVCDADGARNHRVRTQMLLLRSFLWNRGVSDPRVVAPRYPGSKGKPDPGRTEIAARRPDIYPRVRKLIRSDPAWVIDPAQFDDKGKPLLNGVDDHIGAGCGLDELRQLGNEVNLAVQKWIEGHPRKTMGKNHLADARDAMALEALLITASQPDSEYPYWTYWSSAEMLATVLEFDEPPPPLPKKIPYAKRTPSPPAKYDKVKRAMRSLVNRGALEKIEGSDEIKRKWVYVKGGKRRPAGWDYEEGQRPRYRIVPKELEPSKLVRRPLSELPESEFYNQAAGDMEQESKEDMKSARIEDVGAVARLADSEAVRAAARLLLDDSA